ncbi:uncharacterized protein LOC134586062 [Pelobates fuscus]|uniref:uncharacterized protein LOC134586062 n=1 Tax=Pelobates fuscus TaxID=191477 RepID=UPI002FE4D49C
MLSPSRILLAMILTTLQGGYWVSPGQAIVPLVWRVQEEDEPQGKLLCMVQGMFDTNVTIWFSNGNGTNIGTFQLSNPNISSSLSVTKSSNHHHPLSPLTSVSFRTFLSPPSRREDVIILARSSTHSIGNHHSTHYSSGAVNSQLVFRPTKRDSHNLLPSHFSNEDIGVFVLLSLPIDELRLWSSVACFVTESGKAKVWSSKNLSLPGEDVDTMCVEEELPLDSALHLRWDFLQLLTLRILALKALSFNLLLTCASVLQTRSDL